MHFRIGAAHWQSEVLVCVMRCRWEEARPFRGQARDVNVGRESLDAGGRGFVGNLASGDA